MRSWILFCLTIILFNADCPGQSSNVLLWQRYRNAADTFRVQKSIDSAIKYYALSKEITPKDSVDSDSYIQILTQTANLLYQSKSQYAKAEPYYKEARELIKNKYGKETDAFAANANMLGQVYYFLSQFKNAEQLYLEAKQIWEHLHTKKSREYAGMCNALGILYNDNGEYEKAEAQHFEARAIREQLFTKENGAYAQSCNNLAAIYWNLGQYELAEPLALEAKEIRGRVAGIPKSYYAISCVNLANIYRDMGKYPQAEPLYIEARKVREDFFTKDHDDYALSCNILADLYFLMKQYDKAETLYLEAKEIREKIGSAESRFYAQGCGDLAQLYRETGKYDKAETLGVAAGMIFEKLGTAVTLDLAMNNNSLGALYFAMHDDSNAEQYLLLARNVWKKYLGEDHPFYSANSLSLARVYSDKNELQKAADLYEEAFESQNRQAGRIFTFTSEEEKQLYLNNIGGTGDEYQSFYFKKMGNGNKGLPYSISLLKRNQILSSSRQLRQLIFSSGDTALSNKYTRLISLKKQLAALYSKGEDAPQDHLKLIREKADLLEKDLVRSSNGFKKMQQPAVNWKNIQQQLKPTDAAIEFISFNYFDGREFTDSILYAALLLRKELTEPLFIPLFEKTQLDNQLLKKGINPGETINLIYSSTSLFKILWQPIEKYLQGITKIYYAPAGNLHRISFAGVRTSPNQFLGDKYKLVQLLTTASVSSASDEDLAASTKIILYGDVKYNADTVKLRKAALAYTIDSTITRSIAEDFIDEEGRGFFEALPNSGKEVDAIAEAATGKNFAVVKYKGVEANEESVKSLSGTKSPVLLHITTHGFFYPDPVQTNRYTKEVTGKVFKRSDNPLFRSGLIMAGAENAWGGKAIAGVDDGILTAYEISNMYFPNAKLVTLSACETALGDIKGSEGVYGLQRAFKMAGVENLVMSLWTVPDAESAEFMELFYKNMFENKSINKAFITAQNSMRDKYRNEPYKWAAWILVK